MSNTTSFPNQNSPANLSGQSQPKPNAEAGLSGQAQKTADRATAEANSLASEAKTAVNDLGDRAKQGVVDAADRIRGMAEEQKSAGADRFKGYAGSINRAADSLDDEMPMVANFARKAAGEIDHLADSVKDRELSDLVGVVHDYARRQPAIFLGATALAGFLAVRFLSTSADKRSRQAAEGGFDRSPVQRDVPRPRPTGYTPS